MNQTEIDEALALADATRDVDISSSGEILKWWVALKNQHNALQVLAQAYREKEEAK